MILSDHQPRIRADAPPSIEKKGRRQRRRSHHNPGNLSFPDLALRSTLKTALGTSRASASVSAKYARRLVWSVSRVRVEVRVGMSPRQREHSADVSMWRPCLSNNRSTVFVSANTLRLIELRGTSARRRPHPANAHPTQSTRERRSVEAIIRGFLNFLSQLCVASKRREHRSKIKGR